MSKTCIRLAAAFLQTAATLVAAPASAASVTTQASSTETSVPPVTIPRSQSHDIQDPASGRTYRLMLWRPADPPPPAGYPVVYILDANSNFGLATNVLDIRSRRAEATGILPAVIVGIGYPIEGPFDMNRRTFDFTPPTETLSLPERPNGVPWPPTGGADAFLQFIEGEVKPLVAATYRVDETRETLMGHSFGGLFALHVLFTKPSAFDTYVANSPSIWFNNRQILAEAESFIREQKEGIATRASLLISVGALEQTLTSTEETLPHADRRQAWKEMNRMVDNARDLAAMLEGTPGLAAAYTELAGEDHTSAIPLQISRGLAFALAP